jgi:hypothetical protein
VLTLTDSSSSSNSNRRYKEFGSTCVAWDKKLKFWQHCQQRFSTMQLKRQSQITYIRIQRVRQGRVIKYRQQNIKTDKKSKGHGTGSWKSVLTASVIKALVDRITDIRPDSHPSVSLYSVADTESLHLMCHVHARFTPVQISLRWIFTHHCNAWTLCGCLHVVRSTINSYFRIQCLTFICNYV